MLEAVQGRGYHPAPVSAAAGAPRSPSRIAPGRGAAVLAALAVALSAVVYRPLLGGYFFADDFVCMFNILNRGFFRFVVDPFGGHILFVRNAAFWISQRLFGLDPEPYNAVVLLTHLLNVGLLFRVARRMTDDAWLACLAALMWGTSPLCLGTLGWYSVYGQVLVATITLFVLDGVLVRAGDAAPIPGRVALGWYLLLLAGTSCFGTGIGVALAFPAVLFLLRPQTLRQPGLSLAFVSLVVVVPALYFGFWRLYALWVPLTMSEAILQHVALSHFVPIADMVRHLFAYAITGVLQSFYFNGKAYPGTASQIATAVYLGTLLIVLIASDGATRRRLAALACLALAVYLLIAMGRSNMYVLLHMEPADSAKQVRYHYVGMLPLTIGLAVMLAQVARWAGLPGLLPASLVVAWLAVIGPEYVRNGFFIDQRPMIRSWVRQQQKTIASRIDGAPPGADVYLENIEAPLFMMGPMLHQAEFPGLAGIFVLTYPTNVVEGRRIVFVEPIPQVVTASKDPARNHRLAGLLVSPDDAAARAQAPRP